ncbi:MAG: hypothetical protein KDD19_08450 [Phaeodactylibacter sp.]|nr:hypothetical protein [Phaeodactylibacter sp.]MCB9053255.1 hypothetical protein [Lewinellaceae bacterium]
MNNTTIRINPIRQIVWLAVFFLLGRPAFSQDLGFERIPNELGLSQNLISCLLQDSRGRLWIGTASVKNLKLYPLTFANSRVIVDPVQRSIKSR